jgi:hypothetical protein
MHFNLHVIQFIARLRVYYKYVLLATMPSNFKGFTFMLLLHEVNIRTVKIEFAWLSVRVKRFTWETHYVSATKPNRLMLFREIIAVYCENHTEHTNNI